MNLIFDFRVNPGLKKYINEFRFLFSYLTIESEYFDDSPLEKNSPENYLNFLLTFFDIFSETFPYNFLKYQVFLVYLKNQQGNH